MLEKLWQLLSVVCQYICKAVCKHRDLILGSVSIDWNLHPENVPWAKHWFSFYSKGSMNVRVWQVVTLIPDSSDTNCMHLAKLFRSSQARFPCLWMEDTTTYKIVVKFISKVGNVPGTHECQMAGSESFSALFLALSCVALLVLPWSKFFLLLPRGALPFGALYHQGEDICKGSLL